MKKIIAVLFVSMLLIGSTGLLGFVQRASAAEPLTISGWIQHKNESGTLVGSRYIRIEAWEKQAIPLTDYEIAEGYTDDTGHFTFTQDTNGNTILNEDPGLGESGTRDIYIKCFAENEAARVSNNWLNGILGAIWSAETTVHYDVAGPTWDISIDIEGDNSPAFGIPALIKADRDWLSSRTGGWTRDRLDVLYPDTDWPNFFGIWVYNVMRIPDGWADDADTISHEYGHGIHYSTRDGNWPLIYGRPTGEEDPNGWPIVGSGNHWIYSESSDWFALTEGWAEFFAAARHQDQSLETNNYWMGADGNGASGPNTDGTTGEIVEGAFASILWDIYDGANDDGVNNGFSNLWTVFKTDQPDRIWSPSANDDFYHYWINRFGQTRAVDEIFIDHGIPVTDDSYDSGSGNDNPAAASNLGTVDASKRIQDLIVTDIDWYKFTTSIQGNADSKVVIEFDKNRGDLDLFVYRSDDTLVGTGVEFAGGKEVSLNGENPNTFKIKVVGAGDDSATSGIYEGDFSPNYDLKIVLRGSSGGPDSFGYTFTDSDKQGGPTYDWIEISETGTEVLPSSDDQWVGNIGLGFFFNYYGTDYSQLAIGNNGLLFSGVGTSQYVNQPITQTPSIHGLIAPFWDDIVTWGSAGAIYYETRGISPNRKFVVEWYDNQHYYSSTSGITFEAILYEGTNNILFQYKDVDFGSVSGSTSQDLPPYNDGGSATVGIEDPAGSIGVQYSFNQQVISPGLAILFKFPAFAGTNMYLSMNAPASMDHGSTMTYTLYYNDFGDTSAQTVALQTTLSPNVDFMSASDGGVYDSTTRRVNWNIGTVPAFPSGRGFRTVTVTIPASVPEGTVIQTTASISTTTLETRIDDNTASTQTAVTGSNLPPNVGVGPTVGTVGGMPSIYWRTPITFTYYSLTAAGVDIRIHLDDGGSDMTGSMTGSMTGGPPTWTYTTTFYPRIGHAAVTYTVLGTAGPIPALPSTIRVLRTATGQVEVVNFEDYVKNVLPNEWIASWDMNALKAGAMAVKTYAWYWTIHHSGQNYDVDDSTAYQVYMPGTSNPRTNQAVEETWNWVMTKNGAIFMAQYDSGTAGSPEPLYPGRMSQWGTQYWAETGKDWQWIVHYYYDPIEGPFVPSVTFNIYVDPAGYIYDVVTLQRISGASVWLQRSDGEGGWENVPTGQTPAIMQPDVNPQTTGADGQYQWDVLEGTYRVHVEAPGYYPADSIVVNIPPPVTDLHVGLTLLPPPPDPVPPTTTLTIGDPKYTDSSGAVFVTSDTPFTLTAEDNVDGSGVATTGYRIRNAIYDSGWAASASPIEFYLTGLADGSYFTDYNSTDNVGNTETTHTGSVILDNTPPTTTLTIGIPQYTDSSANLYVASWTPFGLLATDGGSGVSQTCYRICNATHDSVWLPYVSPFTLAGLGKDTYVIEYNSTDNLGNVEPTHTITVILDSKMAIAGWAKTETQQLQSEVAGSNSTSNFRSTGNYYLTVALRELNSALCDIDKGLETEANVHLGNARLQVQNFYALVESYKWSLSQQQVQTWKREAQQILDDIAAAINTPIKGVSEAKKSLVLSAISETQQLQSEVAGSNATSNFRSTGNYYLTVALSRLNNALEDINRGMDAQANTELGNAKLRVQSFHALIDSHKWSLSASQAEQWRQEANKIIEDITTAINTST